MGPEFSPSLEILDSVLVNAMTDALKSRVLFLVTSTENIERLVARTTRLTLQLVRDQLGVTDPSKVFVPTENQWLLKTSFGGFLFFYPAELLTPDMDSGSPEWVYWPSAGGGKHVRVPAYEYLRLRQQGNVWRPVPPKPGVKPGKRSVWDHIADPDDE